jgi:large subunit ribosomal protein L15
MPYKRGFTNIYKADWEVVNLARLEEIAGSDPVTPEWLHAKGVIRGLEFPVKILARGEITKPVQVSAHAFSAKAKEQIEKAGGTVTELERTDKWVTARPRSRRLPLNAELKRANLGKSGGPQSREDVTSS